MPTGDAPDWQRVVIGPGGTPPVAGGLGTFSHRFAAAGFLGVTVNPDCITGHSIFQTGNIYLSAFVALATGPAHNLLIPNQAGATLSPTTSFVGIYDFGQASAGHWTLLAISASGAVATAFASPGLLTIALSSNPTLTAGQMYAAAMVANTNQPTMYSVSFSSPNPLGPPLTVAPWIAEVTGAHTTLTTPLAFSAAAPPPVALVALIN